MACIVDSIERNTVTITAGLTFLDVGISAVNMSRTEVLLDCRTGQSTLNLTNMCVTAELTSTTNVRVQRGGNTGAMVCHITVIQYSAASGVLVDRGTAILNANPLNIAIPSRTQANRYSRVFMRTSTNSSFQAVMATHDITSATNLQITGNAIDTSITFVWQAVYIPDATVYRYSGLATGTSFNQAITAVNTANTYCVTSMNYGGASGIDDDEFKGAKLTSSTNLEMYSFFADSHNFITQVIERPANRVERNDSSFAATSFSVNWLNPVDWNCSFINLACPYGYFGPATFSNDAGNFMVNSQLNTDFAISLFKFAGAQTSRIISEVVYIDGANVVGGGANNFNNLYRGAFRGNS